MNNLPALLTGRITGQVEISQLSLIVSLQTFNERMRETGCPLDAASHVFAHLEVAAIRRETLRAAERSRSKHRRDVLAEEEMSPRPPSDQLFHGTIAVVL